MPQRTHLSLFSGIGGLDLEAEAAGFRAVGQCEWADYPTRVLEKHWPDVPRWRDIRDLTGDDFYAKTGLRTVDVVSGGFPCQPFSVAGKQKGKGDDRYLWPEMRRVIAELAPHCVVGENVPGIMRIAAADVVKDLERLGYRVAVFDFEAAAVGAYHRRERIAFVAYRDGDGQLAGQESGSADEGGHRGEKGPVTSVQSEGMRTAGEHEAVADADGRTMWHDCNDQRETTGKEYAPDNAGHAGGAEAVVDSCGIRRKGDLPNRERVSGASTQPGATASASLVCVPDSRLRSGHDRRRDALRLTQRRGWPAEPNVGRVAHGIPDRVDRLRCLGNAVVPQQFYPIFRAVMREMEKEE